MPLAARWMNNSLRISENLYFNGKESCQQVWGKNLAIPHGKVSSIEKNYASFAILNNPVEFGSVDQQPVKLAFLLVGPENNNSMHIKLLSRISRLMNSTVFRQKLEKCTTPEEVYNAFYNEERRYFGG